MTPMPALLRHHHAAHLPRKVAPPHHHHHHTLRALPPRLPLTCRPLTRHCLPTRASAAAAAAAAEIRSNSKASLTPEQKSKFTRPPGWVAPGPAPVGPQGAADLAPAPEEDLSFLTGDWRIFQLKQGHRWSIDDMLTAAVAIQTAREMPEVARHLDIGCGIGSVLLMVAWGLPHVEGRGVEAQDVSVGLARRSIRYNCGAGSRVQVLHGDARDPTLLPTSPKFDLITGTPPYIPPGGGIKSARPQKGPCCFEERGGIEEYCSTAARYLEPGTGRFVVCSGIQGQPQGRTLKAAEAAGLRVLRRVTVVPIDGKLPLFNVDVMCLPVGGEEPVVGGAGGNYVSSSSSSSDGSSGGSSGSSGSSGGGSGGTITSSSTGDASSRSSGSSSAYCSGADAGAGVASRQRSNSSSSSSSSSSSVVLKEARGDGAADAALLRGWVAPPTMVVEELVVRAADGRLTEAMLEARQLMGLPPPRQRQ